MKKYLLVPVVLLVIGFGYYAISPLFRNTRIDEQLPVAAQSPETPTDTNTDTSVAMETDAKSDDSSNTTPAPVTGTAGHPASGTARIVSVDGKNYVRYENLKTINGPDLYVYLSKDLANKDIINLGKIKATEGNINYEIPAGVNPEEYPYVLIWCEAFGVLFNSAKIN